MMMAKMVKDEWVRAAMTDDNVVVEFLVRLKQAMDAPPAPRSAAAALKCGIRRRRSKAAVSMRCVDTKRDGDSNVSTRRSPTTPLSWNGGGGDAASPSAAEGSEETSRHIFRSTPAAPSRSKGIAANETTSTTSKRSRKKKTFAQLKEEENLLLKERVNLKKEIASMLATSKEQIAKNENLKRIKLDLNLSTAKNPSLIADQPCQRIPLSSTLCSHTLDDCKAVLDSCTEGKALLFDLNMMPFEDDFSTG